MKEFKVKLANKTTLKINADNIYQALNEVLRKWDVSQIKSIKEKD